MIFQHNTQKLVSDIFFKKIINVKWLTNKYCNIFGTLYFKMYYSLVEVGMESIARL